MKQLDCGQGKQAGRSWGSAVEREEWFFCKGKGSELVADFLLC